MSPNMYHLVQSRYGNIANLNPTEGKHDKEGDIAMAFGYSLEDLASLPEKTNLGISCANPIAFANVKEGEAVLDLGSGGDLDVILAARKVGGNGKAIGIDMTNNCVINLVPTDDQMSVFFEVFRLLKPGGRVTLSDILARQKVPDHIASDMALYVGCIAGASQVEEYEIYLKHFGFQDVLIVDAQTDLNLYKESTYLQSSCCSQHSSNTDVCGIDFNEWAGSFQIYAVKE